MTDDYYATHFEEYHRKTFFIDPTSFLQPLTRFLPPPAHVLDIGCGSGRDLSWFQRQGYKVTGLERSPGLACLARDATGAQILEADFEIFDFNTLQVDALVLVGALVHLPPKRVHLTLQRMLKALRDGGYILVSMKEGCGLWTAPDGRTFYLWQDKELRRLFDELNLTVLYQARSVSSIGSQEIWLSYVLQLGKDKS
ncbi:MAG: class I SAM-dependent methyltransferase [Desulfosoma sp.]